MKIISKFKDYYDFLIGKYGIDERLVFNRNTTVLKNHKGSKLSVKTYTKFLKPIQTLYFR